MGFLELIPTYTWIIVGVSCAIPLILYILIYVGGSRAAKRQQEIMATGIQATAVVEKAWQTRASVNNIPMIGLRLAVEPPDREPFQIEVKKLVSLVQMGQIQPGSRIAIKYDPAKPDDLVLLLS